MAARPEAERPLFQAVRYLLDTCIIEALLKEETGHEKVRARIGAPFDAAAAHQAFLIQRYLRQTGQQIGRTDPMIAAQAIAAGAVCVTDNLRHFLRIPGLTIENWLRVG